MAQEMNLSPASGDPIRVAAVKVSHDFLATLGISPTLGRSFTAAEDTARGPNVVLISDSYWLRGFHHDAGVLGETVRLDEQPYTIVGVVPDAADFGIVEVLSKAAYGRGFADRGERTRIDVWMPLQADPETLPRETHPIFV